ncbi:hypothetical protein GS610_04460 [Ruegeria sp. HKCCD6228]|uniref:hypothetical protein n=1 Tax=Ruegeria sp. HKCCD6228 TaxID=2683001 RepID=UPI0014930327|nr:hypothetical protein [Ruegeria sp. HKCCD6228]NOD96454.1 hypothetical protein [Ruegeria sp. HKCCD6228]
MKPAFALSFSATGITLHHRSDDDWFVVGTIPLDVPDLSAQIQALREKAFALENDLSCKLVLPEDQVRFLKLSTDGLPPEGRTERIESALTEATPYALSELSYDSQTEGDTTYVAAVAVETLAEARTFASEHGFVVVAFTAEDEEGAFPREALFRETSDASDLSHPENQPSPVEMDAVEQADDSGLPTHPIAGTAAPEAFRVPRETANSLDASSRVNRSAIPVFAAVLLVGGLVGVWLASGSDPEQDQAEQRPAQVAVPATEPAAEPLTEPELDTAALEAPQQTVPDLATDDAEEPANEPSETETGTQPDLTATDAAILEALKVAPTAVESVALDPETQRGVEAVTGISTTAPAAPEIPETVEPQELYLASLDNADLFEDAVALPPDPSFDTDAPFEPDVSPNIAGTRFDLDENGLVVPTPEGTVNPEGIVVYLGRPSKVPPETPVRFEEEPVVDEVDDRLAGIRPKPRPADLVENFERGQLGGRSLEELASKRPKARPESLQTKPQVDDAPTALAVVRVPRPKSRPAGLVPAKSPVSNSSNLGSTAALDQKSDEAGSFQPKTVAPKIPSTASVARQATIDNAINLRRLNLIGVYGTPANRRALVRLPSGRYKKLKVGDRLDGGKVIAISDSELRYQKKGRNVTLAMPRS